MRMERMTTARSVSPEEMVVYRATARRRWKGEQREIARRRERARQLARRAAKLLRERFGAERVVAFGSLVHGHWFSKTSDVDLAVWGVESDDYLVAVARLQDLSSEFKIDLIAAAHCKPALLEVIAKEGVRV
jgi:predicted nucleotidyltransferase